MLRKDIHISSSKIVAQVFKNKNIKKGQKGM